MVVFTRRGLWYHSNLPNLFSRAVYAHAVVKQTLRYYSVTCGLNKSRRPTKQTARASIIENERPVTVCGDRATPPHPTPVALNSRQKIQHSQNIGYNADTYRHLYSPWSTRNKQWNNTSILKGILNIMLAGGVARVPKRGATYPPPPNKFSAGFCKSHDWPHPEKSVNLPEPPPPPVATSKQI